MKIVHVVFGLTLGGIETMLANIANCQSRAGHDVRIMVVNNLVDKAVTMQLDPGITLHRINRPVGSKNPYYIFRVAQLLRKLNPDIVHMHHWRLAYYVKAAMMRRRCCLTMHATLREGEEMPALKWFPRVFAISRSVYADLAEKAGVESEIIYNGINAGLIKYAPAPVEGTFRIVQLGRLVHKLKAQDLLLRALKGMKTKRPWHLTLIGEGPSEPFLRSVTAELGLEEHVTFAGPKSPEWLQQNLHTFNLLVQPSRFEGFGLTVAEAMAAGVPVLVSDIEGPMEIVERGRYGATFPSGDADALRSTLARLIDTPADPDAITAARQHVIDHYDVKVTAEAYLAQYRAMR